MPRKPEYTKEQLIRAGVEYVQIYGWDQLNARSITKRLYASTQIVYNNFGNMEELKCSVLDAIEERREEDISSPSEESDPFLHYVLQLMLFGEKYPNLEAALKQNQRESIQLGKRETYKEWLPSFSQGLSPNLTEEEREAIFCSVWMGILGMREAHYFPTAAVKRRFILELRAGFEYAVLARQTREDE